MKTKVACYYRFSREGQSNYSIEAQQRACLAYCKSHNYEVVKEYKDEGCSASKNLDKREEFLEMIDDAKKKKFEIIVVHKIDRFSRGDEYETAFCKHLLKQSGVKRESVTEQGIDDSPEGEVMEKMLEIIAHYFSRNLSREAKKGQYENALKGKHNGGLAPLGYKVNKETGEYELNKEEAKVVKKIYEMFLQGYGYDKIAKSFPGLRTRRNKPLGKGSIHDILKNEKYTGVYIYNQSWVKAPNGKMSNRIKKPLDQQIRLEGKMPVIIDKATWLEVQKKLEQRKSSSGSFKTNTYTYLLSNVLICGECGSKMSGTVCRAHGYENFYYECGNYKRYKNCSTKKVRVDILEKNVLNYLKEFFTNNNFSSLEKWISNNIESLATEQKKEAEGLRGKLQTLTKQIENAVNLYVECSSDVLKEKIKELNLEKLEIESRILNLSKTKQEVVQMSKVKKFLKDIANIENLERDKQKRLIDTFIKEIKLIKNGENYLIKISSNLPKLLDISSVSLFKGCDGSPKARATLTYVIQFGEYLQSKIEYYDKDGKLTSTTSEYTSKTENGAMYMTFNSDFTGQVYQTMNSSPVTSDEYKFTWEISADGKIVISSYGQTTILIYNNGVMTTYIDKTNITSSYSVVYLTYIS